MSWNDYRAAMDELPISENFEDRICAAVREARREDARAVVVRPSPARAKRQSRVLFPRATTLGKVAVAAAICLAIGGTAYATASFEDLARIAADADQAQVAEVFEQGAGERIDETQRVGDFDITLLGLTSGQALVPLTEGVNANRTYAVLSLARADGSPIDQAYLDQSAERWLANGVDQGDGSMEVDASRLPKDEHGFSADALVLENLDFTPVAVGSDGAIAARGEQGVASYIEDGAIYIVVDMPAEENGLPVNYLAIWLGAFADSDSPGNRLSDRLEVSERGTLSFVGGIAGALFELPQR